jgi:hypothetical protein
MTPQASFAVAAALADGREGDLRALLASMNRRPGVADPDNGLVPFGRFERLHFARFVVLDDQTVKDIAAHGVTPPRYPLTLAFVGDCDGPADEFLADLAERAGPGLRRIFAHCQGGPGSGDLLQWMKARDHPPATYYVNWVGRTVRQVREESALRQALEAYLDAHVAAMAGRAPAQIGDDLRAFVARERQAGRLDLTAAAPTPPGWRLRALLHAVGVPLVLLLALPLLLLYLPLFAVALRRRERTDPEITPRPDPEHVARLADLEDHDVTNQVSILSALKPGWFRRTTLTFMFWLVSYTTRHVYSRGFLGRAGTIHFARWTLLNDKRRLLFVSNYDGSLESYTDDFINKVAFGLNVVFGNAVGYPRTRWLFLDGAKAEQPFKYFVRRHALPTEVWYNAHPGLTAFELLRNGRIRAGLEQPSMTDGEVQEWLRLL